MQKVNFENLALLGLNERDISLIKGRKIKKLNLYTSILHNPYLNQVNTFNLIKKIENTSLFKLLSKRFVFENNINLNKNELIYISFKMIAPVLSDLKKDFKKHKLTFKIATYQDAPLSLAIDVYSEDIILKSIFKEPFLSRLNFDLFVNRNLKTSVILGNYQTANPIEVKKFCKNHKIKYFSNFIYSLFINNFKNKKTIFFLNPNYFKSLKNLNFEHLWNHKYRYNHELKDRAMLLELPLEKVYAQEYKKDCAEIEKRVKGMHKSIANKFGFKRSEKKKYWSFKNKKPK